MIKPIEQYITCLDQFKLAKIKYVEAFVDKAIINSEHLLFAS